MNACTNVNEPVLLSLSFIIRAIKSLCDIIAHTQTGIERKEWERENLVRYAGFACNILVYNIEQ
jgi:hypothetical protein